MALRKLTTTDGGQRRIISDPPMIMPIEDVFADVRPARFTAEIGTVLASTGATPAV